MRNLARRVFNLLPLPTQRTVRHVYRSLSLWRAEFVMQSNIVFGKLSRLISRPRFPEHPGGKRYVHLGCGEVNHPAYINVDALPRAHIHYVGNISRLNMFSDRSVDFLYASHCLEHISYLKTLEVLKEWYRVLKPGGALRLSVPDLDRLIEIYEAGGRNPGFIIGQLYGGHDNPYNVHMAIFNQSSLERLLMSAGFEGFRIWSPGDDHLSSLDDFSSYAREVNGIAYPVSLNLEASKPDAI